MSISDRDSLNASRQKIPYDFLLAKVNHPYPIWSLLFIQIMPSSDTWPQLSNHKEFKHAKSSLMYTFGNCKSYRTLLPKDKRIYFAGVYTKGRASHALTCLRSIDADTTILHFIHQYICFYVFHIRII